ncbi:MAG: GNAT family N-acetyltransferase [Chloroflexi bacterium]|nr:MAG: GNAT family N-acetyltransferase [Chloroflexota bacterium]
MALTERPVRDEADLLSMSALVHRYPRSHLHVIDLPYRLSSWALDDPENGCLWIDGDHLAAWAVLQTPFWTVDTACRAEDEQNLIPAILAWAEKRASAIAETFYGRPVWFADVYSRQAERRAALEQAGFADQINAREDAWSKVLMGRPAEAPLHPPHLAEGFTIRPLAGEAEVEAYVALHREVFESRNMTTPWRLRTLLRPEYIPATDLVAVSPGGELAGFCVGWFDPHGFGGRPSGQIEPMGVRETYRKAGLGKALLAECVRRLVNMGAGQVYVETDHQRGPALRLYQSLGFRVIEDVRVYRKDVIG